MSLKRFQAIAGLRRTWGGVEFLEFVRVVNLLAVGGRAGTDSMGLRIIKSEKTSEGVPRELVRNLA